MDIRNIDYKVDENGLLVAMSNEKIRQTEHNIHRLRVYADFEQESESPYIVSIVLTRADGFTIGPVKMILAQDEGGNWYRYYDIKEKLTEVVGELFFGVAYHQWEENEDGVLKLKKTFPIFTSNQYVHDTNRRVYDRDYDLYQRISDLEGNTSVRDRLTEIEERLNSIGMSEGYIKAESLTEANESEKAKKAGAIAFIIE